MDDVRSDHLSCYGYHRETSPYIDRVAQKGVLFENAFSTAEWSPPSHASIFTGKYPSYHKTLGMNFSLRKENVTLAEILSRNGYQTAGISSNPLIGFESGFNRGFQDYIEFCKSPLSFNWLRNPRAIIRSSICGPDMNTYRAKETVKNLLRNRRSKRNPFFIFANFMNCHHPYDPPRPFKKKFCKSFDESKLYIIELVLNRLFNKTTEKISNENLDIQKLRYIAQGKVFWEFMLKKLEITPEEWDIVKSWYDGEIAYSDYLIRDLVNFLNGEGLFENSLLIITSDHGESFGEHGLACHTSGLYDTLLQVPLIMTCPDLIPKGERIKNIVSTLDIFSTILDISNVEKPDVETQSESLYPFQERVFHDFVCAECGRRKNPFGHLERGFKSLRTSEYKYIISDDRKAELYNIKDDPLEQTNLLYEYPDKGVQLREQLEKALDISYFGLEDLTTQKEELLNRLKALGYI